MLYIKKTPPSANVRKELTKLTSTAEWRDLADDDTDGLREIFDRLPKDLLRTELLKDQHNLCAYCMSRLSDSNKMKIEHYKPLSSGKQYALDYDNFLIVCDGGEHGLPENGERVLCCDASKGNTELNVLNPMDEECMSHIVYDRQGKISFQAPAEWDEMQKKAADKDLNETLQLNGKMNQSGTVIRDTTTRLVKNRREAYRAYEDLMKKWDKQKTLNATHIRHSIEMLESKAERDQYVGVTIFFLKRKLKSMRHFST